MNKELRWRDEINLLDVKLEDIELKNNLIEKIVREEVKLDIRDEEIKILGELVKHQQNNWNELKEQIEVYINENRNEMVNTNSSIKSSLISAENDGYRKILDKMQEIEGGVDNE